MELTGTGAIAWVLPGEYQVTEESMRADAQAERELLAGVDVAFRQKMIDYEDWDLLIAALARVGVEVTLAERLALPLTVRLATPEDGPVPLPEF
jgi:hypothetical protein